MDIQTLKGMSKEDAFKWASQHSGVPADVLDGLWQAESGRGTAMLSPAGAEGHFQIMPGTRKLFEKRFGHAINPQDFHESLYLAAEHLRDDMRREKGDLSSALRAYNNGPDWREKQDPRGENAAYAQRVLSAANRTPEAAQAEVMATREQQALGNGQILNPIPKGMDMVGAARAGGELAKAEFEAKESAKLSDLAKELFGDGRVNALSWYKELAAKPQTDVRFDYYNWEGREAFEAQAQTTQELMFMRENVGSEDSVGWVTEQLEAYRNKDKVYDKYGAGERFFMEAGISLADPVGIVVGLGASKAFGLSRASLRALAGTSSRAGVAARVVGAATAEGAAGNMLWELGQDVTGQVKTVEDYVMAGAFGAGFAGALAPIGVRGALRDLEPTHISHVEAFRRAEVERMAELDAQSRAADPVAQAQRANDIIDEARVGGTTRRESSRVIPDELLVQSVADEPNAGPVKSVAREAAEAAAPVRPKVEAPAAPSAPSVKQTAEAAPDPVELELEAQFQREVMAEAEERVVALDTERDSLLKGGKLPRKGSKARQRYDEIMERDLPTAQEEMLLAYERSNGELMAPKTEGLELVRDGNTSPNAQPMLPQAQETLLDSLLNSRKSNDIDPDMREATDVLLHYAPHSVLRATDVNFVPLSRGVWRPARKGLSRAEIVTPGDKLGGAGMNSGRMRVLIHEAFHAVTADAVRRVMSGLDTRPHVMQAVDDLITVFKEFRVELANREIRADAEGTGAAYAGADLLEFISQAMMDPQTQRILSEMRGVKYGPPTLWDKFWQSVVKVLGLEMDRGTRLYDVMKQVEIIVKTQGNIPDGITSLDGALRSESVAVKSTRDSNFFRQLYEHARKWNDRNPIDKGKTETLANKYTSGAVRDTTVSDGLKMASSKNPIARMLAGTLVEVTTGAAGRRTTADLLNHLYHGRIIGNSVNVYDHAATAWVQRNKGGWLERFTDGKVDAKFDRLVSEEILNRRMQRTTTPDPEVKVAADAMQALFQRSLDQQKQSGTLGSAWLPDDAIGYLPQSLKGDAIRGMTVEERRFLQDKLAAHWATHYKWDDRFAVEFAHHYITRAQREAAGERHVDHVATNGATSVIKDTLASMSLEMRSLDARTAAELEKVGGAPYTKHRLDIPLLDDLPNGKKLMDYFDTDLKKLARSHARSVSGQAALAEKNILGQRGANNLLRAIREAEAHEQATPDEIAAVERVFSAFLGTPWHGEHRNRLAAGAASFTRLRLMGGLAFTQLGELVNGMHMVGMGATMEATASLPRMFSEVKTALGGKAVANAWLGTLDRFNGVALGTEQYRMSSAFDAPDDLLREYGKGANIVEKALASGNYAQAKVSLFRGLHAAQHRAFTEQIVIKAIDYLDNPGAATNRYLDDMGFNAEMRKALKDKLPAAVQRDASGNAIGFDIFKLESVELMEDFAGAVNRGAAQIIQDSFVGEKGAWAHSDLQKLAFQLRTFGLTATEKQWARNRMLAGNGVEGYAYAAGVLMAQMAFVTPIYLSRLAVNAVARDDYEEYIGQGLTPAALVQAMMNYSSAGGLAGDAFDTVASLAGGWNEDLKQGLGARSFGTGVSSLVPTLGTADQAMRIPKGESTVASALKMLPGSNLPYVQAIINATR